jgi:hypothetical protein
VQGITEGPRTGFSPEGDSSAPIEVSVFYKKLVYIWKRALKKLLCSGSSQ